MTLALGGAMVLGTWVSKRVLEQMPVEWLRRFVGLLPVVIALQMIITG
jgi:uncharacterized membrane protein YfcA